MRLSLFTFLFCCFFVHIFAQTDTIFPPIAIGEWRQHLPWQRATYVTLSETKVYFATEWAVVEIDKADRSPRFLTKVEGLSDVGMGLIRYNQATKILLLTYSNSNIDLYDPAHGTILNLPFIAQNINIIGDKKIYDVAFDGKFAYLACGFGIVKLNLERAEAEYTTFTGTPVISMAVYMNALYAGTEEGIFRVASDDFNPADFSRWHMLGAAEGFPVGMPATAMSVTNGRLYAGIGNTLYSYDGSTLENIASIADRTVAYLSSEGAGLVIGWKHSSGFGSVEYLETSGNRSEIHGPCQAQYPLYAVEDGARKFWFADVDNQFRFYDHTTNQCERFTYNSPYNHKSTDIAIGPDGTTYVATPGPPSGLGALFGPDGVYVYKNNSWTRWNKDAFPELEDEGSYTDMWKVAPHPTQDKVYVGSFVGGLLEFSGGDFGKKFTKGNSILQSAGSSGPTLTAIAGLAFDADENLWFSNYAAGSPVAVLKADGTLRNFSGAPNQGLLDVVVDQSGYKWFVLAFNNGVMVYDSGADIDSPADDRYRVFTTSNSALPTNTVNCLAVDLEGDVWVGTQQGVVSFECGSNVFDASCTGRRRIVNVDDFNGYLLETEDVRTIAVDGANRKWFGTTSGIFVQSPDALTQVANFTSTNSPLFDNTINDIAINQKSGEVWIGTGKGVISLRGEATEGGKINSLMPYAYPNPVRPEYDGPIAIYGLARDANVKITDISGNLVYEGKALGGQAVWNGRDYAGRRAASGVYLIYATSEASFDTPDAIITKVVILN